MKNCVKKTIITILAAFAAVLCYGVLFADQLRVAEHSVYGKDLPQSFSGTKIVFASDFHCGFFLRADRVKTAVNLINSLNPDIIILGGDYIDKDPGYIGRCFLQLKQLKARQGVYAVLGNHDYLQGMSEKIRQAIADSNIILLENSGAWLESQNAGGNNGRIRIAGTADLLRSNPNIENAINGAQKNDFTILVSHNPFLPGIVGEKIDLSLSGHTHGGQVVIFNKWSILNLLHSEKDIFFGQKNINGTEFIISRGVGTTFLPIRLFSPAEINLITLRQ